MSDPAVDALLAGLDHPLTTEIEAARELILGVDPSIGEGVKWNAPSFRTSEWFATVNLRSRDSLQLILHLGAKVRPDLAGVPIADPEGLLKWLGKDRAMATLGAGPVFEGRRAAFAAIIGDWIAHV
jgi:hypothetical protein